MKLSFLFWNLYRKPLQEFIVNLASQHEISVLMLVECIIEPDVLLKTLNRNDTVYHYAPSIAPGKIELFTRFPNEFMQPVYDETRLTIRHLKLPGMIDILLAVTHFPSKMYWDDASQALACGELAASIRLKEEEVGHSRTALVGDFNMNPFEDGVVNAYGLHGVVSRKVAARRVRTILSKDYPFFYNPMWGLLGDATPGPPGTYYYRDSKPKTFFWNMFDQVLIRPDLLPLFDNEDLRILTSDGETSFLSPNELPNTEIVSDHLPIFFKLKL
jgi:hypothetical protein